MNNLFKIVLFVGLFLSQQAQAVKLLPYNVKVSQRSVQETETAPVLLRSSSFASSGSEFEHVGLGSESSFPPYTSGNYACAECKELLERVENLLKQNKEERAIARAREHELNEKQAFLRRQLLEVREQLGRVTREKQSACDGLEDIRRHVRFCVGNQPKKHPRKSK